jgi:hypothetical protein
MSWRSASVTSLGIALLGLWPALCRAADDQQLVADYLQARGAGNAVIRPIADDFVARTFPNFAFFGAVFRQYPVAVTCPQAQDLKCANVFWVKDRQVGFAASVQDLEFFFGAEMGPAPSKEAAADAASTWLRFSGELKQDLFYSFSPPEITYTPGPDITRVRARATVASGGEGQIDAMILLGSAGTFVRAYEKSSLKEGIRPICQATKLLDRDPIVRRMAEQDLLVMGRAAKLYLDSVRSTARPKLQDAIDRIWQRIVEQGR